MTVKTGATWAGTFVTLDATGALSAGTPSGTLYVDGVANGASVTITGSNPYKFSVTLPTLTAGQRVDMYITATISGIATAAIVASEQADTHLLSDGVTLGATQGAITWGQQKILANIAGQGALEIYNSNATGRGLYTRGQYGQFNYSSIDYGAGVFNQAIGTGASAQKNSASGAGSMGLNNAGVYKNVSGFDSEQALEETLTAMKGAGWTTETLAALHVLIDAIKAKTDNLPTSPAATGAAMTLADGAITASKFDESTAFPVKLADTGATQIARVGADSDTLETLSDQVDAVKAKTDMITTGITVLTIASPVIGSTITAIRGDTLVAVLEGIGSLVGYSKVYFTVKRDYADADTAAIIQIENTAGLKYLNGAAGTPANGSLTIVDEASGDITIALDEVETAKLDPGVYSYDVQVVRTAGSVSTLTAGTFEVAADVTRATA